jgi:multiple sugar transport system substrate-binding protein
VEGFFVNKIKLPSLGGSRREPSVAFNQWPNSAEEDTMNGRLTDSLVDRRTILKAAAGLGLTGVGGVLLARETRAQSPAPLSLWTTSPELVPYYEAVASEYGKTHPNVKLTFLSASAREMEKKLAAAIPTGTGPDIMDIGLNISIQFIEGGFIDPNPPDVDQYFKGGGWNKVVVDALSLNGETYGLPLQDYGRPAMFYNKSHFREAGIEKVPTTSPELIDAARKLVKFDSTGKMTRSGISLRLSGQGSGVAQKFLFVLAPAGGSVLTRTASGKWRNNYDNASGRDALKFYVDAVQTHKIDDPRVPHDADAFVAGQTAILLREAFVIGDIQKKNPSLDYGVAPIPRWKEGGPYKMLVSSGAIYVNGRSSNKTPAYDFIKYVANPENSLRLTTMTGWISMRQDIDWAPLLQKTPQFGEFVSPRKDTEFFTEPTLSVREEINTKLADRLVAAFVDPSLKDNPDKIAEAIRQMAGQTDQLLKSAGLYGAD